MPLTTPAAYAALSVLTSTKLTAEVHDQFTALLAAGTSYTPTWGSSGTQPALGNGTLTGQYYWVGNKIVYVRIRLTLGTTSTVGTGNYTITLPSTPGTPAAGNQSLADCWLVDSNTGNQYPFYLKFSASLTGSLFSNAFPTGPISATGPVVPATSDTYELNGHYWLA